MCFGVKKQKEFIRSEIDCIYKIQPATIEQEVDILIMQGYYLSSESSENYYRYTLSTKYDGGNMTRKLTFKQKNYISAILFILIFSWLIFINYMETKSIALGLIIIQTIFYVLFFRIVYWLIDWVKK